MKLALGTVQLGLHYGIANTSGKPSRKDALEIIQYAVKNGVDTLDTASGYGDSEQIIGEYLADYKREKALTVVTKIPEIDQSAYAYDELHSLINQIVGKSARNLKTTILDCCLLHAAINITSHNGYIVNILKRIKEEGKVKKIGVSIYTPAEVQQVLEHDCFDVIQVPFSILDQRLITTGLLQALYKRGLEIHTRSAFLQGLLLMDPEDLPTGLTMAARYLNQFRSLSQDLNLSKAELALLFVRDIQEINKIIVGCENIEQLRENINIFQLPSLRQEVIHDLKEIFNDVQEYIINPSLWRKS